MLRDPNYHLVRRHPTGKLADAVQFVPIEAGSGTLVDESWRLYAGFKCLSERAELKHAKCRRNLEYALDVLGYVFRDRRRVGATLNFDV